MEALQGAYVRSVAAASGAGISVPEIDEGIDYVLTHRADSHLFDTARLEMQLKSTTRESNANSNTISVQLTKKRYDYLRTPDPTVPKILVMMTVPAKQADWIHADHDRLHVRHASFWLNLEGFPASTAKNPTVSVPIHQIFDDIALCAMMSRIGQGGKP
ncbi:DUF4365 domain-containing protein [Curtobacterium sp. MCPF17_011]|nr:DUF4365 domain-containing protein [Curtobacterium sp. MCPF17_011]